MCSIFGIGFFRGHTFKDISTITGVMSRLFKEGEVAGRRAAGLSIMRGREVHVLRRPVSGSELVGSKEYLDFMHSSLKENTASEDNNPVMSIIGHCRWPTQGSPENNLNNHPQVIDNIIGVHNGVVNNDHELFRNFRQLITRKAEVDTEIIFQLIRLFNDNPKAKTADAIREASKYLRGSYACGMQNTNHPFNLYLFRKHNPIQLFWYPDLDVVLFATRESFIRAAFEDFVHYAGVGKEVTIPNDRGLVFNLWNHTMARFSLKEIKETFRNAR